jgi:polyisoprenoid-binding protein YceI
MTKQKWKIDPLHSSISFKIRHLGFATVTGSFKHFSGILYSEADDLSDAEIFFTLEAASIDTNNPERDKHLRSADFLEVDKFDTISFEGTMKQGKASGNLTIKSISKPVTLDMEFEGSGKGRFGEVRAGFEVATKINRRDYGLTWNIVLEAGQFVVGEEIKMQANIELIKES